MRAMAKLPARKIRVILADDHPVVRDGLAAIVNQLKLHVQTFPEGKQPVPGAAADSRTELKPVRHRGNVKGVHQGVEKSQENGLS